jgi:hypothetical protein
MARTSTRRWALLPVVLIALPARGRFGGGRIPIVSYRRAARRGRLWQCPVPTCLRVELVMLPGPRCSGTPEDPHEVAEARPVRKDAGLAPSDDRQLFE